MHRFLPILLIAALLVSCKKEIVVFDDDPNAQFELPLILQLNAKNCCFDAQNGLLKYSLDKASLDHFSPFIHFQDFSSLTFDGKLLQNNAINDLGTIELHKVYTLKVTTEGKTEIFGLVFTNIPIIQLVTFDDIPNEPKALARMTLNYPETGKTSQTDWIGIELRGASSLSYPKKSYGITTYGDASTSHAVHRSYFDFAPNEDWILDAMYIDASRLRNKTSFELWSSLGPGHDAIQARFVEVFLNNRSVGLYDFSDNLNAASLQLNSTSVYYRGTDNTETTFFEQLPHGEPNSANWGDWEQKYPKPSRQINWADFSALSKLITQADDGEFKNKIGQQVDLDNVIDYYLFINLCGGFDNVGKNWSFLKRNPSDKFTLVPWDLDATWGRTAFGEEAGISSLVTNAFFQRLLSVNPDDFRERLHTRWEALRANQFSLNNLRMRFATNAEELNDYRIIQHENTLWNQSLNLQAEKSVIDTWIINRLAMLDLVFQ